MRGLAASILLLLAAALALAGCDGGRPSSHTEIAAAEFAWGESLSRIPAAAEWRPVRLPDSWNRTKAGQGGVGWYRATITVEQREGQDLAFYIPRISNSGSVWINGRQLHLDRPPPGSLAWRWNSTLFIDIPEALLLPGANVIHVAVAGLPNSRAGLSRLHVGDYQALARSHELRRLVQSILPPAAGLVIVAMSIPLLLIWLRFRTSSLYGLFAVASVIFALRSQHGQVSALFVPAGIWWALVSSSLGWALGCFFVFILRFGGYVWKRVEAGIALFIAVGTALLFGMAFAAPGVIIPLSTYFWYLPLATLAATTIGAFLWSVLRRPSWRKGVVAAALLVQMPAGIHDLLWQQGTLPFDTMLIMPLSMPVLLVAISWVLADEFGRNKVELTALNAELQQRIEEATRQLRRSLEREHAVERQAIAAQERLTLIRDMHDGVGSRLAMLIAMLERGRLNAAQAAGTVRDVLDDLRLIIESRDADGATIADAFGNLRHRLSGRLAAAGLASHLSLGPGVERVRMAPERTLHLLRIVQESVSNTIRHAGAARLDLRLALEPPALPGAPARLELMVKDDGRGFDVTRSIGRGRGLRHLQQRAQALGGELAIRAERGTEIRLSIPLSAAEIATEIASGSVSGMEGSAPLPALRRSAGS